MIAKQNGDAGIGAGEVEQVIDGGGTVGATVDKIAHLHQRRIPVAAFGPVRLDQRQRAFQLGQVAVNISDRVNPHGPEIDRGWQRKARGQAWF